jgi:hypothetical protein
MKSEENSINYEDRRQHKRISYWLLAKYKQKDGFKSTEIKNISKGGLLLSTEEPILIEEPVTVQIYLPSTKGYDKLIVQAKPIWQKEDEKKWLTGVSYINLSKGAEGLMSNFINYLIMLKRTSKDTTAIPYWCIANRTAFDPITIQKKKTPQIVVLFESSEDYSKDKIVVLDIKLPTYTMPFNVEGQVIKSIYDEKNKTYFISLGLHNLESAQLAAIKKFSLDK